MVNGLLVKPWGRREAMSRTPMKPGRTRQGHAALRERRCRAAPAHAAVRDVTCLKPLARVIAEFDLR